MQYCWRFFYYSISLYLMLLLRPFLQISSFLRVFFLLFTATSIRMLLLLLLYLVYVVLFLPLVFLISFRLNIVSHTHFAYHVHFRLQVNILAFRAAFNMQCASSYMDPYPAISFQLIWIMGERACTLHSGCIQYARTRLQVQAPLKCIHINIAILL